MNSRMPPRYLPTLTEVVYPKVRDTVAEATGQKLEPIWEAAQDHAAAKQPGPEPVLSPAPDFSQPAVSWDAAPFEVDPVFEAATAPAHMPDVPAFGPAPATAAPDRQALAQQLIKLVQPQLEAELRNIAMELFEAQFSALLPSLQLHIEEAVREALEQALPEQAHRKD